MNNQEWTRTIDEYVKALYEQLRECLKLAQESATKEANRQKRLYDRKVGAIELRPGDRVLVHLDAFRGQRRKLKNRWGDDIHTVIDRKADGIPTYRTHVSIPSVSPAHSYRPHMNGFKHSRV